jgi:phthiocerol/phenolphthiocerol synthesis type-I polyketide synthase E
MTHQVTDNDIAIIGMSGRFPDAENIEQYWQNLVGGVNSIKQATEEEIIASGVSKDILNHKRFVNASSKLNDAKYFDADFFGLANSEATIMDPQIRLLLQTSWHAIEDAGYDVNRLDVSVGNFCGMSTNSYLMSILDSSSIGEKADLLLYRILNEKDFLATWISYKLNLTGPAFSVQTACSTSLLAVHLACQSLLNYECDMALAGGVSFDSNEKIGYVHVAESIYSKDGICRPFDSKASGTISGDGVGSIVLKRATEAIKDKDHIYALIKGSATNNDGANKQGYTTPSVDFQRDVVLEAMSIADVNPETIGMIEAHGTGTFIGDPIEVSALTEAFREYTKAEQYCAIGSVKSNIGHLDAAAGIASIIKAVLCVNKGILVPSLNFSEANPALNLNSSPFYVSQSKSPWPEHFELRRAGVTSLGVGGTNVHLIVEQPPLVVKEETNKQPYVIGFSALNQQNLQVQKERVLDYIVSESNINLADVEYTSLYGRKFMPYRFSAIFNDKEELISQLKGDHNTKSYEGHGNVGQSIFMFPGQGSQYANMAKSLYLNNELFKKDMDFCFDYLKSITLTNFKEIIFSEGNTLLNRTENTQICLFIIEYCLTKELLRTGIKPDAIIGHSLGEYVAACIVGCMSLNDALKLVYHRGRLMGSMPEGEMLLVQTTEEKIKAIMLDSISICVFNTEENIVIGGAKEVMYEQSKLFEKNNIEFKKLKVSHAYHTQMMTDVLTEYDTFLSHVEFKNFDAKVFSTFTGNIISSDLFCSKKYWLDQIIHPVKFLQAVKNAASHFSNPVFIEIGPGNGLSSFIKSIFNNQVSAISLLPKTAKEDNSTDTFYEAKAILYAKGLAFNIPEIHTGTRISMPGCVFSKNRFWKPKININHDSFLEIKDSYHYLNENFQKDRLRSTIEIQLDEKNEVSNEILNQLNDLHIQYVNAVKSLFSTSDNIKESIETLYNEVIYNSESDAVELPKLNEERKISNIYVEPKSKIEIVIAQHWGSILGYSPVGVLDNYFEVGGNSLLATKLLTQLSDEFEITIVFKDLSEFVSISELATLIESKIKISELVDSIEIDSDDKNFIEL